MSTYANIPPGATGDFKKFTVNIPDQKVKLMELLVKHCPIAPEVYENNRPDRELGMTRKWLSAAKDQWTTSFKWRDQEEYMNLFPQWTTTIKDDDDSTHTVHFAALFSANKDAVPVAFFHGWPGNYLEFYGMLQEFTNRYEPDTLPFHLIVPSLTGYAFSSPPPKDKDWSVPDTARLMHKLLLSLGFPSYAAQGGDVGSGLCQVLAARYSECKCIHLNALFQGPPEGADMSKVTAAEWEHIKRGQKWQANGSAYALEHGTRPGTIGLVLGASPVGMLAWIGEKYLEWTDEDPSVETVLRMVSLYWLTDCYPSTIYPYRAFAKQMATAMGLDKTSESDDSKAQEESKPKGPTIKKPFGFSQFPGELLCTPEEWARKHGDLVFYRSHEKGGHFAALENPEAIATDVEEFIKVAWKN